MSDMDDLLAFYSARLDEAETLAKAADPGPWEVGPNPARKGMVYIREEGDLLDSVGLTWREPVFTSQVPNKTRFRENAAYIAAVDPKHRLADIALKRAILAEYVSFREESAKGDVGPGLHTGTQVLGDVARQLGTEFSDHADYRAEEWAP